MKPPAGFIEIEGPRRSRIWVRAEWLPWFEGHELLPAHGAPVLGLSPRPLPGRGGAFQIGWPGLEWSLAYRRALRGGLVRRINRDRFWGRLPRPWAEVEVSEWSRSQGVPTPEIAFSVVRRTADGGYRGAVATRWLEDAVDLADALSVLGARGEAKDSERVRILWDRAGRVVRRLHEAGVIHADLNLRNLLVTGLDDDPSLHVLDLDRARRLGRVPASAGAASWKRLERSLTKFPAAAGVTGTSARSAFQAGYELGTSAASDRGELA